MTFDIEKIDAAPHILVVDDDQRLRELIQRYMVQQGAIILTASDAAEADMVLEKFDCDLMVLDVMMPGEDGVSFAKRCKVERPDFPILMLTAKAETEFRIEGLEAGVDDYMPKPFEPRELWLRTQAILRRTGFGASEDIDLKFGEYTFVKDRRVLEGKGQSIPLTESETALLIALSKKLGETYDRFELADALGLDATERTLDVQVTRLRKKIEPDPKTPRYLQTVRGQGYRLRSSN